MPTDASDHQLRIFQQSIDIYDEALRQFITAIDMLQSSLGFMVNCGAATGAPMPDITEVNRILNDAKAAFARPLRTQEPTNVE